jgi:hypothetical protein
VIGDSGRHWTRTRRHGGGTAARSDEHRGGLDGHGGVAHSGWRGRRRWSRSSSVGGIGGLHSVMRTVRRSGLDNRSGATCSVRVAVRRPIGAWPSTRTMSRLELDGKGGSAMRMACFSGGPGSGEGRLRRSEEEMRATVASDQMG